MLPIIYHSNYSCEFPENHRFVMSKFVRLYEHVKSLRLIEDNQSNLFFPEIASLDDLSIVHDPVYLNHLLKNTMDAREWRRIGLPWSEGLIERTFTAPNGTLLAARLALQYGMASHLAGGTHHAHRDFGSGFCMINDLAYASAQLIHQKEVKRILIFDCDVHQGDGTASIMQNWPNVFTCSIHCEKNFPFRKHKSDLDIGLDKHLDDQAYLEVISNTIHSLLEEISPDLVLYDAGVDIWQNDELGHLNVTMQGMQLRDETVLKACLQKHIPVATVIGGGYDKDHARLARRHSQVVDVAHHLYRQFL